MDVWYVSYGSNLAAARFGCYLRGGIPAGARRRMVGCRDARPARDWRRVELPWRLRFAGDSTVWGGGVAYVDVGTPGRTHARAWRISCDQFADVVAQENGVPRGSVGIDADTLCAGGPVLPSGKYGRLVALPDIGGVPAVTFTNEQLPPYQPPSPAYRAMLRTGLGELGLHELDLDRYLEAAAAP